MRRRGPRARRRERPRPGERGGVRAASGRQRRGARQRAVRRGRGGFVVVVVRGGGREGGFRDSPRRERDPVPGVSDRVGERVFTPRDGGARVRVADAGGSGRGAVARRGDARRGVPRDVRGGDAVREAPRDARRAARRRIAHRRASRPAPPVGARRPRDRAGGLLHRGRAELLTSDGTSPGGHPEAKGGDSRRTLPTLDPEARVFFRQEFRRVRLREYATRSRATGSTRTSRARRSSTPRRTSSSRPRSRSRRRRRSRRSSGWRRRRWPSAPPSATRRRGESHFLDARQPGREGDEKMRSGGTGSARAPLREWFLRDESSGAAAAVHAAVRAGARATTPRHLLRPLAQLLVSLLDVAGRPRGRLRRRSRRRGGGYRHSRRRGRVASGRDRAVRGAAEGWPDDQTRRGFGEVLCGERGVRARAEAPRRWVAAACDFFLVCQRELALDALLGHQMG